MKNHEFQKLVDQSLSGLEWDEAKQRKTLLAIDKEEKAVKRFPARLVLIAAVLCLCICMTALAAGIMFSKDVDATALSDEALFEKYGITLEMQTYFNRTVKEAGDKHIVRYDGVGAYEYVLGRYTSIVEDGKAEITWSHDGEDTTGGFDAKAWGAGQLSEMLKEGTDLTVCFRKATAIAKRNGAVIDIPTFDEAEAMAQWQKEMMDAETAKKAAKLTVSEMEAMAREALSIRYQFTPEQAACLMRQEDSVGYALHGENKLPVYRFYFSLGYIEDGYQGEEGRGIYHVAVNVESGVIEDMLYDSALGGCG